jgi:hypothetical protein
VAFESLEPQENFSYAIFFLTIKQTTMKNTIKSILVLSSMLIMSCGQKSPEQEAKDQQRHDDSLRAAIVAEINAETQLKNSAKSVSNHPLQTNTSTESNNTGNVSKKQVSDLVAKANQITDAKLELNKLNVLLTNAKSKLEYENNELARAEQYHLGRTKTEREIEIRNQDLRVQAYQNYVQKIQDVILQLHEKINTMQSDINVASNQ